MSESQREVTYEKTRRGGKSWKRKMKREERIRREMAEHEKEMAERDQRHASQKGTAPRMSWDEAKQVAELFATGKVVDGIELVEKKKQDEGKASPPEPVLPPSKPDPSSSSLPVLKKPAARTSSRPKPSKSLERPDFGDSDSQGSFDPDAPSSPPEQNDFADLELTTEQQQQMLDELHSGAPSKREPDVAQKEKQVDDYKHAVRA